MSDSFAARDPELGQTTVFVAILLLFVLVPMVGVVIEGGRIYLTYRKMQSSADLAALVAAQKLPTASTARQDGCAYAYSNGFGGGANGTSGTCLPGPSGDTVTVCVPPLAQSPYGWMSYTSGGSTPCDATATSAHFVEVQISKNLGTVPIFNVPVTLYAHSVARSGIPGASDYAIVALDPTSSAGNGIDMNGLQSGIVAYGSVSSNDTASNSLKPPGAGIASDCGGGFYTAASEPYPGNLTTYNNGSQPAINFGPASCRGAADGAPNYQRNAGKIADPYAASPAPTPCGDQTACSTPSKGNMYVNCNACGANGWYTTPTGTGWTQNDGAHSVAVNGTKEFFPGVYGGFSIGNGDIAIFNPGVYTLTGDFKVTGGTICVFGAPVCDHINSPLPLTTANCANSNLTNSASPPATWNYYCSPFGFWDPSPHGAVRPSILSAAPKFLNTSTGDTTGMSALNGVTFYLNGSSTKFSGNPSISIAAPNPCAGTGALSGTTVPFPQGSTAAGGYTYPAGSYPQVLNVSPTNTYIYPSMDFTRAGECANPGAVWSNEFGGSPPSQHMQFLFFQQDTAQSIDLTGTGQYNWVGIIHSFKQYSTAPFPPPPSTGCSNGGCNVKLSGNSGAGANGPPMLYGQIVGGTDIFNGSSIAEVFNRPGGLDTGAGTSLIQ